MNYFSGCRHRAGSRFRWLSFVRGFGRLLLAVIAAQGTEEVRGKRQKTYIGAAPARMLKRSALCPQATHRAHRRSLSLEVSGPHRMTGTAQAIGAECRHFSQ